MHVSHVYGDARAPKAGIRLRAEMGEAGFSREAKRAMGYISMAGAGLTQPGTR